MITFRALTAADYPLLLHWLQQPHVAAWWPGVHTLDDVIAEFEDIVTGTDSTHAYIVELDDRPLGYMQVYVAMDSGDGWWQEVTDPGVRGIDQFIGEADMIDRGFGTAMIRAVVEQLFRDPVVTCVQADPDPRNHRAIRCYEKAGFIRVREIVTPDGVATLMLRERVR